MPTQWPAGRFLSALAAMVVMAGVLTGLVPAAASAAACQAWTGMQPPSPGSTSNVLDAVTVLSPCDAWAVGSDVNSNGGRQTLTEHWDGSSWTVVPSPDPGSPDNSLSSVRAVSARNIWAVGYYTTNSGAGNNTLILHWDGTSWTQVPSPSPGTFSRLYGVRTVSASNAWAVGFFSAGTGDQSLILHWNGRGWTRVPSPSPGGPGSDTELFSVAATSARNAWAVGENFTGTQTDTLILHWNGTRWARAASPSPGHSNELFGVGATSRGNAWAVGLATNGTANQTLILHWNGRRWKQVASPNPAGAAHPSELDAVTATSARNAWAVGLSANGTAQGTLVLHWNGTRWIHVRSPNPGTSSRLFGVAAGSAGNVWAVGGFSTSGPDQALALHCC